MRWLTIIFIFTLGHALAQDQAEYRVVKVVGSIESPSYKRLVKTGDTVNEKDQLTFKSQGDYLIVISPKTGRKKISGVPDSNPREFWQLLQSFLKPELKSTSTRGASSEYIELLKNSMASETLLVLGDGHIPINTSVLSLVAPASIKAWYTQNKKIVYKKISEEGGFNLSPEKLFDTPWPSPFPKVTVEYLKEENDDPFFSPGTLLASFTPVTVDEKKLAVEIKALLSASAADDDSEKLKEVNGYLLDEYATPQQDNLKLWLKANGIF